MMYVIKLLVSAFLWTAISAKITWNTQWINNSRPYKNGTEIEPLPNATYLNTVCPNGSGTLKIRCQDNKGEPFVDLQNITALHFVVRCNVLIGLLCKPWAGYNASCYDFVINFGCDASDTTTAPAVKPTQGGTPSRNPNPNPAAGGQSNGTTPPVTGDPVDSNNQSGRKESGGSKAVSSRWLIVLIVSFRLFRISL